MAIFRNLLASFLLALLAAISGCSEMPPGLDVTFSLNGDPLGVGISIKNPPRITASGPSGFSLPAASMPATVPAVPNTAP